MLDGGHAALQMQAHVGTDSYAALLAHVRYPHRPTNIVTQQVSFCYDRAKRQQPKAQT